MLINMNNYYGLLSLLDFNVLLKENQEVRFCKDKYTNEFTTVKLYWLL